MVGGPFIELTVQSGNRMKASRIRRYMEPEGNLIKALTDVITDKVLTIQQYYR